jgi:hypothetical protein
MELLGDEAQVDAHFGPFEIVLILTQDWCMVLRSTYHVGHLESRFGLFRDSVSIYVR